MEKNKVGVHAPNSPYSEEECEAIIAKLEDMLDGRLTGDEKVAFEEMVNNCQFCLEQYRIEKSLRQLIKEGFNNMVMSNKLVANIKNSIRAIRGTRHEGANSSNGGN
jgi:anti-sigma factor (TIGR02949 family)